MRGTEEIAQIGLLLSMIGVALFTLVFPWSFRRKASRRLVHLPLSLILLYPAYEATISPNTDIRIDLLFLWPLLGLAGVCYGFKLLLLSRAGEASGDALTGGPSVGTLPTPPRGHEPADTSTPDERLAHLLSKPKNAPKT